MLKSSTPHISRSIKDTERDQARRRANWKTEEERLRGGVRNSIDGIERGPRTAIDLEFCATDRGGSVSGLKAEFEEVCGTGSRKSTNERCRQIDLDWFRLESMREGEI